MGQKPKIALVGFGYWGPNLMRNLISNQECTVVGLAEAKAEARTKSMSLYPQVPTFESLDILFKTAKPDAVVIATPPSTHCALAVQCLQYGAHVLVEKPLASSVEECDKILAAAEKAKRLVMVDHTFVYNPAVDYLSQKIHQGSLGKILYYDSVRVNLGGFQPKTNVLWDLAPHDLSIIDTFTGGKVPTQLTAVGIKHFGADIESLCYLTMTYEDNFIAHLHLNWAAPVKIRTVMVGGTEKMAIYDDNLPTEKIKIYDKGVSLNNPTEKDFRVSYRSGDMVAPAISSKEALAQMISEFVKAITQGVTPKTDGMAGRRVVQILEAATESMMSAGKPVTLNKKLKAVI